MNLQEIKTAIENGKKVFWSNSLYQVKKCSNGEYLIICSSNDYAIGLTWRDGVTMNGKEQDFYVQEGKK